MACAPAAVLAVAGATRAAGDEDLSGTYDRVNEAVVLIDFEDATRQVGSGVIVGITEGGDALVLTADHVVEGYDEVRVRFAGDAGPARPATVSQDWYSDLDLAVVVVPDVPPGVKVIRFRQSAGEKGERVGAIGHPQDETFTWSEGTISNVRGNYVFHDARLERGSSGGPLLDGCGRLLGLNVQLRVGEDDTPAAQDEDPGTGIALAATSIASVLDGWLADTRLSKKWSFQKYCSWKQRLYKQPLVLVGEVGAVVGLIFLLKPPPPDDVFGAPPDPPAGN